MFVLFEDAGKYLGGRVLSEAQASAQVELDSGKRVKVKDANIVLRFDKPAPAELLAQARVQASAMDLNLAWEFAPAEEFGFGELASDYFGDSPGLSQQAAALLALFEAPHYFRRAGKGRFKKAPAEVVQQALAAIEKKQQLQAQISEWAQELAQDRCPAAVRTALFKILFKPDKNAPEYKAVAEAVRSTQRPPLDLLRRAGAIDSPYQFHWQRFLFENFPKGTAFPPMAAPAALDDLPLAEGVQAFSIDDSQTTEIDDALSVHGLGSGTVTLGVHIAAPALAFGPGSPLDQLARARMSTVYMPGHKLTMLPDSVVQNYTLIEGGARPALSLYVQWDEATLALRGSRTALERVHIAANLRHDQLDAVVTESWLTSAADSSSQIAAQAPEWYAFFAIILYRLAQQLKAGREQLRGKPENFGRPDYNFRLVGHETKSEPDGSEQVLISTRQRGAPLDLIVAETMILANSHWGGWLAELGVPALYRSQASLAPGIKVRMGTKALPHAGLGVKSYAWSTSPLRRYTDLVNQWQLIAAARHGATAALVAPFKPKDAELFSILSAFDAAYSSYNAHQNGMERFWTLQHIKQQGLQELEASLLRDAGPGEVLARADTLPLVFPVLGAQGLPRGARVRVRLSDIDDIALSVHGSVIERLDSDAPAAQSEPNNSEDSDEDGEASAQALTVVMDLGESEGEADPAPAPEVKAA